MIKNKCKKCDILDSVLEQKIDIGGKTGEIEKKKIWALVNRNLLILGFLALTNVPLYCKMITSQEMKLDVQYLENSVPFIFISVSVLSLHVSVNIKLFQNKKFIKK